MTRTIDELKFTVRHDFSGTLTVTKEEMHIIDTHIIDFFMDKINSAETELGRSYMESELNYFINTRADNCPFLWYGTRLVVEE